MNPPAERLFTVAAGAAGRQAERRVRANDAVLTSFVSDLYAGQLAALARRADPRRPGDRRAGPGGGDRRQGDCRGHGEETGVVTILHDLTEAMEKARLYEQVKRHSEELRERVREATAELAEQNELLRRQALELEQASAMKSQFLANVSHELRTPLNAVMGYTTLLLRGRLRRARARRSGQKLERIDSNARHLLSIINDLLDISRIEAGKMADRDGALRLPDLVDEVMAGVEPLIHRAATSTCAASSSTTAAARQRPAEGQADPPQPAVQRLQVHPRGTGRGARTPRATAGSERRRSRWPTPASASRPTSRR